MTSSRIAPRLLSLARSGWASPRTSPRTSAHVPLSLPLAPPRFSPLYLSASPPLPVRFPVVSLPHCPPLHHYPSLCITMFLFFHLYIIMFFSASIFGFLPHSSHFSPIPYVSLSASATHSATLCTSLLHSAAPSLSFHLSSYQSLKLSFSYDTHFASCHCCSLTEERCITLCARLTLRLSASHSISPPHCKSRRVTLRLFASLCGTLRLCLAFHLCLTLLLFASLYISLFQLAALCLLTHTLSLGPCLFCSLCASLPHNINGARWMRRGALERTILVPQRCSVPHEQAT